MAVVSVVQLARALGRGDLLAAAVAGGWALATLGALSAIAVGRLRSGRLVGTVERSGITFRPDRFAGGLVACCFLGGAVASALTLVFRNRDGEELPFSSADRANEPLYMSTLLVLMVLGLGVLVVHGLGYLRLTPRGIETTELFHIRSAEWDDVTAITDTAPQKPRREPISFFVRDAERPIVVTGASGYATNGAALYWMLRHYWLHPENRGELADGRALERLRSEDFAPE